MNKHGKDIKWFEFPSHFAFHYANSWEEGDKIKIFGAVNTPSECDRLDEFGEKFNRCFYDKIPKSHIVKIELDMVSGDSSMVIINSDFAVDFPKVSHDLIGYSTQFAYMPFLHPSIPDNQEIKDNVLFAGFLKLDMQSEKVVGTVNFGETCTAGEVYF